MTPAGKPDAGKSTAAAEGTMVLTPEDRARIHREVLLHADMKPDGHGSSPAGRPAGGQATAMIIRQLGSKVMLTTIIGLFGTLFTVVAAAYHNHFSEKSADAQVSDDIGAANREKKVTVLATFPNEIETAHSILAMLQSRRIWLLTHHAATDVDELGRTRAEVEDQFWQVWKIHLLGKQPEAILTGAKVFFDSPQVVQAVENARDAFRRMSAAATDAELRESVGSAERRIEALIEAMSDEVSDSTRRPKRIRKALVEALASGDDPDHAVRTLSVP